MEIEVIWKEFLSNLENWNCLKVKRFAFYETEENILSVDLHGFCDSSNQECVHNPADIPTRVVSCEESLRKWLDGPEILYKENVMSVEFDAGKRLKLVDEMLCYVFFILI